MKFYRCKTCGKVIVILNEGGPNTICCGQAMEEIPCKTVEDGGKELHLPKLKKCFGKECVMIGNGQHPQNDVHYIDWVVIQFDRGFIYKKFRPDEKVRLCLNCKEYKRLVAVYSHCNVHGLWRNDLYDRHND